MWFKLIITYVNHQNAFKFSDTKYIMNLWEQNLTPNLLSLEVFILCLYLSYYQYIGKFHSGSETLAKN